MDDDDDEEEASSIFYNDLYKLDLTNFKWTQLQLRLVSYRYSDSKAFKIFLFQFERGKKEIKTKVKKTVDKSTDQDMPEEPETAEKSDESIVEDIDELTINDINKLAPAIEAKSDDEDDPFKLEINTQVSSSGLETKVIQQKTSPDVFLPQPRRSMFLQYHKSHLYLYGGKFEDKNDKEITLNDMYSLNLKKLDEWTCMFEDKEFKLNQLKAMESSGLNK